MQLKIGHFLCSIFLCRPRENLGPQFIHSFNNVISSLIETIYMIPTLCLQYLISHLLFLFLLMLLCSTYFCIYFFIETYLLHCAIFFHTYTHAGLAGRYIQHMNIYSLTDSELMCPLLKLSFMCSALV